MMTDETISEDELFLSNDEVATEPEDIQPPEPEQAAEPPAEPEAPVEVKAEEPEPVPEEVQEPVKDETTEANVPSWRLREVTEKNTALAERAAKAEAQYQQTQYELAEMRRQLQAQQKPEPQPAPDIYDDPQGFAQYQQQNAQQLVQSATQPLMQQNMKLEAMVLHTPQVVEAAMSAAMEAEASNPQIANRIMQSQNPWAEAVAWHKEKQTQDAIGEGGIEAFTQRQREELMKDPEFRKQVFAEMRGEVGTQEKPQVENIPSLNSAPATAVNAPDGERIPGEEELFLAS